jgi:hypothetical protein
MGSVTSHPSRLTDAAGNPHSASRLARRVLTAFLFTFLAARILVFLIMSRRMPDLYLHLGGTHVHHLNYGIFLLSGVGAYLLFRAPTGADLSAAALAYGVGLALTFDEFGMWVHLGGSYWQRASFDAVVVIAGLLGLLASAPALRHFTPRKWATVALLAILLCAFGALLAESFQDATSHVGPVLRSLEQRGPQ